MEQIRKKLYHLSEKVSTYFTSKIFVFTSACRDKLFSVSEIWKNAKYNNHLNSGLTYKDFIIMIKWFLSAEREIYEKL